jgi:cytosine permease
VVRERHMKLLKQRLIGLVEAAPRVRPSGHDLRSWIFFVMIQIGVCICVPVFLLGVQLGRHMEFKKLVLAVFAGALVVGLLSACTGLVGTYCRLPTALLLRRTFGTAGGKFTTLVLIIGTFGWFGVQTELLVHTVRQVIHARGLFDLGRPGLTAIAGLLMCSTAVIGFRALGKVAYLAVPLLLLLLCVPLWKGLAVNGISAVLDGQREPEIYSFGFVVSVVSGSFMVGVAIMPDITRFLRSRADTLAGVAIALSIANPLLLCLSAALGALYASGDLVEIMSKAGFVDSGDPALGDYRLGRASRNMLSDGRYIRSLHRHALVSWFVHCANRGCLCGRFLDLPTDLSRP